MTPILDLSGIGPNLATKLAEIGILTAEQFAATSPTALVKVPGIGARRVEILLEAARRAITGAPKRPPKSRKAPVRAVASKASGDARAKIEDTAAADEVMVPAAPMKADKKTDKKKISQRQSREEESQEQVEGQKRDLEKEVQGKGRSGQESSR